MEKNKKIKITVVTVVKNSVNNIEKTINSVLIQKNINLEYIVIDGGSTDGTLDVINRHKKNISIFVSENDNGIWDAMNKGLKLANGEIIGFLNSGDIYYTNTLNIVEKYFDENSIDFIFGSVEKYKLMYGYRPWIINWSFGFYSSHSVGFFIKRKKHLHVGLYNTKFLSADLDFFYKMIKKFKLKGISSKKMRFLENLKKADFHQK